MIRRPDFREVRPTAEELADWRRKNPRKAPPERAECRECGQRFWYSGIAIGSHLRGRKHREAREDEAAHSPEVTCLDLNPPDPTAGRIEQVITLRDRELRKLRETFCSACGPLDQPGVHSQPDCTHYQEER